MTYDLSTINLADARETSPEIVEACEALGPGVLDQPTYEEALAVWERVTGNGLRPSTDYVWGDSGSGWAAALGLDD